MERTGFEKVFCFFFGIFVFCVIDGKRLEIFMLAALRFYELFALLGGSAFIVDVFCIVSINFGIDLMFFLVWNNALVRGKWPKRTRSFDKS